MKRITLSLVIIAAVLTGCKNTITHYDENGKITKIEEATNFSRAMDGTNSKSQMLLIDGTFASLEASASAGENCTPGVSVKFANGKMGIINSKDKANFKGGSDIIEKFYSGELSVGKDGMKKK